MTTIIDIIETFLAHSDDKLAELAEKNQALRENVEDSAESSQDE